MKKGLIFIALFCQAVLSFGAEGYIRGKVTDAKYGDPLMFAYVRIVELDQGQPTDLDGEYSFTVEEGTYTIEVNFEGYGKYTKKGVKVAGGQTTIVNIALTEDEQMLDEFVVTAKKVRNTDIAIITAKKKSAQIFDGIPAEQITRQAANNAADAMVRVTGVSVEGGKYVYVRGLGDRYSKTTLNRAEIPSLDPERNAVQMDLFPSNVISNMKVYKTFSPELPGDFTGGLVNIETKDFPEKFTLSAKISYGFNTQAFLNKNFLTYQGSSTDWLGYDNGTRAIPDAVKGHDVPAINPASNADNSVLENQTKSFNNIMYAKRKTGGINQSYSFAIGNQKKIWTGRDLGYFFGVSYRRNLQNYGPKNNGMVGRYNAPGGNLLNPQYLLNDSRSQENVISGIFLNLNYKVNSKNRIGLNMMQNLSGTKSTRFLEGQWAEDGAVNPNYLFASQTLQYLERRLNTFQLKGEHTLFDSDVRMDWFSSYTISKQDEPDLRFLAYDMIINPETNDTTFRISKNAYALPSRYFRTMDETNWDNKIYFYIPLDSLLGPKAELSFGASMLMKNRQFRENRYDYFQTDDFNGDLQHFFSPDNMTLTPYDPGNVSTFIIGYPGDDKKDSYNGHQNIIGSFIKLDFPIIVDKLKFSGGARYERTDILVNSLKKDEKEGRLLNNDILPAVNITYVVKEDKATSSITNLRLGYSKTIARPTFRELAPFPSFYFTGDFVLLGNPNLVRSVIHNYDVRYEIFPETRGDYFAVSGFYKTFQNPIEKTQNPIASNTEITFKNVGDAVLYGVELEVSKSLAFINEKSKLLQDMKVGANASFMKSQVHIDSLEYAVRSEIDPSAKKVRPMYSQSPYLINGYLTYQNDTNGLQATVSFNVFGKRLALVSQGQLPDVYEMPRPSLDFTLFKDIGKKFKLTFSAKNLLNPQTRFIHDFKGQEYVYSSFRRGRTFTFGLKYKI